MIKNAGMAEGFYECRDCGRIRPESSMERIPVSESKGYMEYKLRCSDVSCQSENIEPYSEEEGVGNEIESS